MGDKIDWKFSVKIPSGPEMTASQSIDIQAYGRIEVTVPAKNPKKAKVEVQPGGPGQVEFLLITSDKYDAKLTYSVTGGVSDVKLDAAQILAGQGALGLLGGAPKELEFKNEMGNDNDATITMLFGRKATV